MTEFTIFPTVGSIAQKQLLRATLNMTIRSVSQLIDQHNVSSVVLEIGDEYFVFSVEDLLRHLHAGGSSDATLAELTLRKMTCVFENERILTAFEILENNGDRYLGVVDSAESLVGILTDTDILSAVDPTVLVQKKTIGELVTRIEPVTFTADWILDDVLNHLQKMEDSIIVVEAKIPVGIITTKDIFKLISAADTTDRPLREYMTSPVITTQVSSTIQDALAQLKTCHIKRSIVVNQENQLVGVVTQSELVGFAYGTWIDLIKHHAGELKELVAILDAKAKGFEKSSLTDPLTGLGNRRMLDKRLADEIGRMRRYDAPAFSLLLLDIDFFKHINDTHGHLIGDEILKAISLKLMSVVRCSDDAIRWGGEEFAILLPHTLLQDAVEFANRLRTTIEDHSFVEQIHITISIGVGQFSITEHESQFLDRVDKALYLAKHQGRNRVVADTSSGPIQHLVMPI
ncbi:diguanylate cyclase [Methylomonas sp. BW4-1]|uniref:diguanylate cyclase n=1 Tax=Methylomonas sp. BW4-1 TaxID=3376685 RepID=UPI0040422404